VHAVTEEANGRTGHAWRSSKNFRNRCRLEDQPGTKDTKHEAKVAHAIDHKGLNRRSICTRLFEPEADEQITGQAHAFPTEEHLNQVVRRHQHEHGEGKEAEICKEPGLIWVFLHIAPAVQMHERRDGRNHHQHDGCQRVDAECPVKAECPALNPFKNGHDRGCLGTCQETDEYGPAERAANEQRASRQRLSNRIAKHPVAQPCDYSREQGQEYNEKDRLHCVLNPSSALHRQPRWFHGCGNRSPEWQARSLPPQQQRSAQT